MRRMLPTTCSVCGRPLEEFPCLDCGGSGKVKLGLARVTTCIRCGGTGRVLDCPNARRHYAPGLPGIGRGPLAPPIGRRLHQKCPMCKGAKVIPHPFTGYPGACPTCFGRGWV